MDIQDVKARVHKLTVGNHSRPAFEGEQTTRSYGAGDLIIPTEAELQSFGWKFTKYEGTVSNEVARALAEDAGLSVGAASSGDVHAEDDGSDAPAQDDVGRATISAIVGTVEDNDLTVGETLALVESGEFTAEEVLAAEKAGKGRKTVIQELEG